MLANISALNGPTSYGGDLQCIMNNVHLFLREDWQGAVWFLFASRSIRTCQIVTHVSWSVTYTGGEPLYKSTCIGQFNNSLTGAAASLRVSLSHVTVDCFGAVLSDIRRLFPYVCCRWRHSSQSVASVLPMVHDAAAYRFQTHTEAWSTSLNMF